MFKFLKEKIGNWAKKITEKAEPVESPKKKEKSEKEITISKKEEKQIEVPVQYNVGAHKFEPDLEKLQEKTQELQSLTEEPLKEEPKPGSRGFLKKITSKITKVKISEKEFEIYSEELRMLLLENNVAFEVADKIIKELGEEIIGKELLKKEIEFEIKDALKKIIENILIEPFNIVEKIREKIADQPKVPYVILFAGINGTGKTTTIAKIADFLKKKKFSCVLAAADTFRAASIEQLNKHGERIGIKVISQQYGADPAAVGFDAISYAKKNFINCVLIDTAGRMHTSKNLLKEIEKISKVCKPDLKLFIGESITGNDSVEQAKSFDWAIGIDGIVLTKADVDEKGGTALSVGYITKKPILFLGTGQEYSKIEVFDKKKFLKELGL
ncbi:MAG TPA: signal recognition particle-docking protein FtsY [Bacillota bacterium]|nr:signal recognition particle-docking protein FtsY [Bacillota bacterium]